MTEVAIRVAACRFGDEVFDALGSSIGAAKGDDPLERVTVVVERAALGLATRRRLAARPPGIANVRFLRWADLAVELAARAQGETRARATRAVELEALRASLAAGDPGRLASARDQPGSLRALARTYRELASLPSSVLEALARQSGRAADVIAVVRAARGRLATWADDTALLRDAAVAVHQDPERAASALGAVVVYLPTHVGPGADELIGALGAAMRVDVVVGMTGDDVSDEAARLLVERLGANQPGGGGRAPREPRRAGGGRPPEGTDPADADDPQHPDAAFGTGLRVCAAPTADAEVLLALRHLMGWNARGVPLGRLAILHGGAAPYPQLIHDALRVAGIPSYGPGSRRLAGTVAGRALLGALSLGERGWRRQDVAAWLASGPLLDRGRPVPAAAWASLAIEAGVVAGLEQWRRLSELATSRRRAARRAEMAGPGFADDDAGSSAASDPAALRREAQWCEDLAELVAELASRFEAPPASWEGWSSWSARLLEDVLGGPSRRAEWPPEEIAAFDAVTDALASLAVLDRVGGPEPSLADFRTALGGELDGPAPQTARTGSGLLAGRVADAVGIELDAVCVVGMVDGAFPSRAGDDVLIPDAERERADPAVPLRAASRAEGRRDFFAALAGAREGVLFYARADQRTGRPLRPARLVLEALAHLGGDGRRLVAGDMATGLPTGSPDTLREQFDFVASYAAAVLGVGALAGEPVSAADWELQHLLGWHRQGRAVAGHVLAGGSAVPGGDVPDASAAGAATGTGADPVLVRALDVRAKRRGAAFTRYDGLVRGMDVPSPARGAVVSATSLEAYARCPRSYLFGQLLRIGVREPPQAALELSPLERGRLVHGVLEQLVATETSRPGAAEGGARILTLAEDGVAQLERHGVVLHPAIRELERERLVSVLRRFVRDDAAYRALTGAVPLAVETGFGWGDEGDGARVGVPVPSAAADGSGNRTVLFRGRIDRIDRLGSPGGRDGARFGLGIIDYKTGAAPTGAARAGGSDPVARGTRLQLPVYALAAQAAAAARGWGTGGDPRAGYWFVGARHRPDWIDVDATVRERLESVVATMADGIERGIFPANPGEAGGADRASEHCRVCPFDALCPPGRAAQWRAKRGSEHLAGYRALAEPEEGS